MDQQADNMTKEKPKHSNKLPDLDRIPNYNLWKGIFIGGLLLTLATFYFGTQKISYIWNWNRIPAHFLQKVDEEIYPQGKGIVKSIKKDGDETVITLQGREETKTYRVPSTSVAVNEGDFVGTDDTLARIPKWKPGMLSHGLWVTLKISIVATILAIIVGFAGGFARVSINPAFKWASIVYVELIRGSPLMVQILIWYFVLGTLINDLLMQFEIEQLSAYWYGVFSLGFFAGAYVTEIVRAGIQSIHRGQTEAALSIGMNSRQTMWYVILPQTMKRILPALAGQFINLIKDSALLGIIAICELTKASREIVAYSLQSFEIYLTVAAMYLILTFILSLFVQYLEKRLAV
jgi:polar amino acid transport system permease protein